MAWRGHGGYGSTGSWQGVNKVFIRPHCCRVCTLAWGETRALRLAWTEKKYLLPCKTLERLGPNSMVGSVEGMSGKICRVREHGWEKPTMYTCITHPADCFCLALQPSLTLDSSSTDAPAHNLQWNCASLHSRLHEKQWCQSDPLLCSAPKVLSEHCLPTPGRARADKSRTCESHSAESHSAVSRWRMLSR